MLYIGRIPQGHDVMHICDNKLCVNPDHLITGTRYENIQDKVRKRRQAKGEKHGHSKLTYDEVYRIKFELGNLPASQVAKMFKVTSGAISGIRKGENWKHVVKNKT